MAEVVAIKKGRGGFREGAGRKPSGVKVKDLIGNFIYVIHEGCDTTVCKIGVAVDPYKRVSTLQVSNWRRLKLSAVVSVATEIDAGKVERTAHAYLSGLHVTGEWFRVHPERAADEIRAAARNLGIGFAEVNLHVFPK